MCHVEAHIPMNIYCNFHAFIQIISDNMVKIKHYNGKKHDFHYNLGYLVINGLPLSLPPFLIKSQISINCVLTSSWHQLIVKYSQFHEISYVFGKLFE